MNADENAIQTVREDRLLIDKYDVWLFKIFEPFLGKRLIEIGCGLGNLLVHLLDKEKVVGIEHSEEVVSQV